MYDLIYPLPYFRRNNKEYMYKLLPSSTADRYLERARAYHWILEDTPSGYGPEFDVARRETFHFLTRSAITPEPGPMKAVASLPGGTPMYDVDPDNTFSVPAEFQLSPIDGRYVADEFSNVNGGAWDYLSWINHSGFNIERGLAIRALLDGRPTLYTISRPTYLDGRNVMKNFRNDDPDAVDRFIGGLLSEDWEAVAMWIQPPAPTGSDLPYGSPQMLDLMAANPTRPANSAVLFPNIGYKNELAAVLFAHLFGRMSTDMTLINKMRVYVEGLDFVPGAIPDADLVKFTDPNSGYTYVARKFGDDTINGKTVDRGIGSRMLAHANDLLAKGDTAGLINYVGLIDATRQVGQIFQGPLDSLYPPQD